MPKMNLSHFEAAFLFALFTSVVLGVVTKRSDRDRLHLSGTDDCERWRASRSLDS